MTAAVESVQIVKTKFLTTSTKMGLILETGGQLKKFIGKQNLMERKNMNFCSSGIKFHPSSRDSLCLKEDIEICEMICFQIQSNLYFVSSSQVQQQISNCANLCLCIDSTKKVAIDDLDINCKNYLQDEVQQIICSIQPLLDIIIRMTVSYHKISNMPFYSLNQFTQLQPLSRGTNSIYLYQHNQSQQIFVVKQIPYNDQSVKVYETIFKLSGMEGIVRLRGICKMVIKYSKIQKKRNHEISQLQLYTKENEKDNEFKRKGRKQQDKGKQEQWILIFMEKYEQNMVENIKNRRKQRKSFKSEQLNIFISQVLFLLEALQKENISHRDIKPENFLYDKGKFKLCDFQSAFYLDCLLPRERRFDLDVTTIQFSSPQFFRNIRQPKTKIFDPFKLDLYSFGLTILYVCSLGSFDLLERKQYLEQNSVYHANFMKEQRRRILKNNKQYKGLNTMVKIMLEEDEYKRDTFITFIMKTKPIMNLREPTASLQEEQNMSQNSKSEESRRKLGKGERKPKQKNKWQNSTQLQKKCLQILLSMTFIFFILLTVMGKMGNVTSKVEEEENKVSIGDKR